MVKVAYSNTVKNDYDKIFADTDLISGDVKSKVGEIKELCGEHNRKTFFENLARRINSTDIPKVFEEMKK